MDKLVDYASSSDESDCDDRRTGCSSASPSHQQRKRHPASPRIIGQEAERARSDGSRYCVVRASSRMFIGQEAERDRSDGSRHCDLDPASARGGIDGGGGGAVAAASDVQRLPPVPDSVRQLFADDTDKKHSDCPALHGGRQRTFAHERGNWATHVYVSPDGDGERALHDAAEALAVALNRHGEGRWCFRACDDPVHVSLSRTVATRHHCVRPLVESLGRTVACLGSFDVALDGGLVVHVNDERTRTFVGLAVSHGAVQLRRAAAAVDSVLTEYGLAPYYACPSFHASLCWALGDLSAAVSPAIASIASAGSWLDGIDGDRTFADVAEFEVTEVTCRCGNKLSRLVLGSADNERCTAAPRLREIG